MCAAAFTTLRAQYTVHLPHRSSLCSRTRPPGYVMMNAFRVMLAKMACAERRKAFEAQGIAREPTIPVSSWLDSYGTDPDYPSRRVRRITERAYKKASQIYVKTEKKESGIYIIPAFPKPAFQLEFITDRPAAQETHHRFVNVYP